MHLFYRDSWYSKETKRKSILMSEEFAQTFMGILIKQRNELSSRCAELEAKLIISEKKLNELKNKEQAEELFDKE